MALYLTTILSRFPASISSAISHISIKYPSHPLLFSISPNLPSHDLSRLVKQLTSFSSQTAGCISAPLLGRSSHFMVSCSLAVLDPTRAVLFRSEIPGRPMPQVGRWHATRNREGTSNQPLALAEGLPSFADAGWRRPGEKLPAELQSLNKEEIGELIFFCDLLPEGLLDSLDAYDNVSKLGLIASPTPFTTGRLVTLFHKEAVHDYGAVGFAVKQNSKQRAILGVDFPGLVPFSDAFVVTESYGNLITSINGLNPTQVMLRALGNSDVSLVKNADDQMSYLLGIIDNESLSQLFGITTGDPGRPRGSISLDCRSAVKPGTKAQFFLHYSGHSPTTTQLNSNIEQNVLKFLTTQEQYVPDRDRFEDHEEGGEEIYRGAFCAASERGILVSRGREDIWTSSITGGSSWLKWPAS